MSYHQPTTKSYDELTKKKQAFIDQYLILGDRDLAYKEAGYSIQGRGWKYNARNLFFELNMVIQERIDLKIGEGAVMALKIVRDIMEDKEISAAVRLNAAKDYLARAGYDKPQVTDVNVNDKRSSKEIDTELADILGRQPGGQDADNSGTAPEVKH